MKTFLTPLTTNIEKLTEIEIDNLLNTIEQGINYIKFGGGDSGNKEG